MHNIIPDPGLDRKASSPSTGVSEMTLWFCLQRHFRVGFGNACILYGLFKIQGTDITQAMNLLQLRLDLS